MKVHMVNMYCTSVRGMMSLPTLVVTITPAIHALSSLSRSKPSVLVMPYYLQPIQCHSMSRHSKSLKKHTTDGLSFTRCSSRFQMCNMHRIRIQNPH